MMKIKSISALIVTSLIAAPINAQSNIDWAGFLTSGLMIIDTDKATYIGANDNPTFNVHSVAGLQVSATIDEKLSITSQIIARGKDDFEVEMEWAYGKYQITPETALRFGRLRNPSYMYSDYLDVGVAYPWVSPPHEVYSQLPFTNYDGIDLLINFNLGEFYGVIQPYIGAIDSEITPVTSSALIPESTRLAFQIEKYWGVMFEISNDIVTLRASHSAGDISTPDEIFDPIIAGFQAAGLNQFIDDNFVADEDSATFSGVAAIGNLEDWLLIAEWTTRKVDNSWVSDTEAWYTTIGYKHNRWTPFISYAVIESTSTQSILNTSPIPLGVVPAFDPALLGAEALLASQTFDQDTLSIGFRYDISDSMAIKFQYDMIESNIPANIAGTQSLISNVKPGFDGDLDAISATLNIVF